jgi:8-oxo-dGTP pyrophosphatase MutT (NUDIX family)
VVSTEVCGTSSSGSNPDRHPKICMKEETIIPEFGTKRENEERRDGGMGVVYDPETRRFAVGYIPERGIYILFGGGVDDGEDVVEGVLREVKEESGLCDFLKVEKITEVMAHYYNVAKKLNRVTKSTCILVILRSRRNIGAQHEAHENFSLEWLTKDELLKNWNEHNAEGDRDHWIYVFNKAVVRLKELGFKS